MDINRKQFNKGDVVFFVESKQGRKQVNFGIVEENYATEICLQMLDVKNTETINGIPKKNFETPTKWQKLPKGWKYDTKLIELGNEDIEEIKVATAEDIKTAYEKGLLVKVQEKDYGVIGVDVEKSGWRVVKRYGYPYETYHQAYISLPWHKVYETREKAQKEVDAYYAELKRQSELSDYEWSVENIEKSLAVYKNINGASDEEIEEIRKRLLKMDDVEDIETKCNGGIQWRYSKNKRWNAIEL